MTAKVRLSLDKTKWVASPLPGQIVLVSTVNKAKVPNVAPKSWISMAAFKPATIGFGCNLKHQTAKNILETKEFVVNIPSEHLAVNIWKTGKSPHNGAVRLKELGFTLIPSLKVAPPRIEECKAHFECVYDDDKRYGDEVWIFGRIVSASMDQDCLEGASEQRYKYLSPIFYLKKKTYGTLSKVKQVKKTKPEVEE